MYVNHNQSLTSLPDLSGLTNLTYLDLYDTESLVCVESYPEQINIQQNWPPTCEAVNIILGCTDLTAFNYDVIANLDDGSCIPVIPGCTDESADNYDENSNTDDGSCILVIPGCTDESAVNYDSNATINDDSCEYDIITQINQSFDAWNISINLQWGGILLAMICQLQLIC